MGYHLLILYLMINLHHEVTVNYLLVLTVEHIERELTEAKNENINFLKRKQINST